MGTHEVRKRQSLEHMQRMTERGEETEGEDRGEEKIRERQGGGGGRGRNMEWETRDM